ncbi:MAG: Iron-dependent repressor IdeR [Candidatus Scalindua arabica]|uniref:Iron-dependent repressor IdeR n=1 Tax=Candidatus Scalindua arabica TaxID=1127984 RepID=A0A941W4H5_9BACT|nr:Iron-dependent repressor IdeR [Candidatus Scalindua arabica]
MIEHRIKEVLEHIWTAGKGRGMAEMEFISEQLRTEFTNKIFEEMNRGGLVNLDERKVKLTHAGGEKAELITRRHRLAERLIYDVLNIRSDKFETNTCQFECFLPDDVISAICTLLGHPRECPHGKAIPMGKCCKKARKDIKALIAPLSELRQGDVGRVVYTTIKDQDSLDMISGIGILHGIELKVHQKTPTFVLQIGESQIALDGDMVSGIYVRCKN